MNKVPTYRPPWLEQASRDRHKVYDRYQRDPEMAEFYNSPAWRRLALWKLTRDPYCQCEDCKKNDRPRPANTCHHIKDAKSHPELRMDQDNLLSMNRSCHSRHHARRQGEGKA
jgi:5-methylcytosine-specific restriction enzyme A